MIDRQALRLPFTREEFEEAIPKIMSEIRRGNIAYACIHFDTFRSGERKTVKSKGFFCNDRGEFFLETKISRRCPLRDDENECLINAPIGGDMESWAGAIESQLRRWVKDNLGPRTVQLTLF